MTVTLLNAVTLSAMCYLLPCSRHQPGMPTFKAPGILNMPTPTAEDSDDDGNFENSQEPGGEDLSSVLDSLLDSQPVMQ